MTKHEAFAKRPADPRLDGIIKLAVMAVGGQGGGVLSSWIESMARAQGYAVQATSVAGVAQRTGATIYYVEMAPAGDAAPVFSLAPAGGDVDILIAAEMMEAGRAIMRGFVTPDRTTLIASTHRALAVSEKMTPGDGIADPEEVRAAIGIAAQRSVIFDMEEVAQQNGSVISSSLFGALAGAEVLPFERTAFEDAIRASGRGVDRSLAAFSAAYDLAQGAAVEGKPADPPAPKADRPTGPKAHLGDWEALTTRAAATPVADMALAGLRKVVEFQDTAYGAAYLDHLDRVLAADPGDHALSEAAAKYIANAMAYDDIIRVAEIKTRPSRMTRIEAEMGADDSKLMQVTEFLHPRAEEIAGMLPARLGAWFEAKQSRMDRLDRLFNKGRRMRTDRLTSFLPMYVLGGMQRYRLRTYRHAQEVAHMTAWLDRALEIAATDYALGVEFVKCRRLVKGYSDTHARSLSKFDRVTGAVPMLEGRDDAADWLRRLREAALQDEKGTALDGALKTVESFVTVH